MVIHWKKNVTSGVGHKQGQRVEGNFTNKWPRSSRYLSVFSDSVPIAHSSHPMWASLQLSEGGRNSPSSVHWFIDVICRCGPEMDHHHRTAPRSRPGRQREVPQGTASGQPLCMAQEEVESREDTSSWVMASDSDHGLANKIQIQPHACFCK